MLTQPVTIERSGTVEFKSHVNGHLYSISIALPMRPSPPNGHPVLYVLDGYSYFGSATEAVRVNDNAPHVIVVGIGYPDDPAYLDGVIKERGPVPPGLTSRPLREVAHGLERRYDLTLPSSPQSLAEYLPGYPHIKTTDVGGVDEFLQVIETDIKPRVAALAPIDPSNQALFGHSLGGLAVLHALFTRPTAFRTFVAASPTIWWADDAVLAGEAQFGERIRAGTAKPRILIAVGDMEQLPVTQQIADKWGMDLAALEALRQRYGMRGKARALTERLMALPGHDGYQVEKFALFDAQHHGVTPWPALGRAVSFSFPK